MALGRSRRGNNFPRGVAVPSVFGVLADTAVYNEKNPGPAVQPQTFTRVQLPGSGATFLYYYTFPFSLIVEFAGGADVNNNYRVANR
jgi:hypothetical protein